MAPLEERDFWRCADAHLQTHFPTSSARANSTAALVPWTKTLSGLVTRLAAEVVAYPCGLYLNALLWRPP